LLVVNCNTFSATESFLYWFVGSEAQKNMMLMRRTLKSFALKHLASGKMHMMPVGHANADSAGHSF